MLKRLLSFCLLLTAGAAAAQTPTWSTDVAAIVYNNCATCHRSGGIAPFPLMTYNDAVAQASAMNADVQSGAMPPWPPDPTYSHMAHERLLSAAQKAKIAAWVAAGTPQGNPNLAPPQPVFSNNGDLPGTANLTVQIPTYTSPAATTDMYRCFVLNTGQSVDKYITAFEAIPGNRGIVHHVLVFADTTGMATQLDAQDPGPGYTSFGGIGTNNAIMLGGWVPGSSPVAYPQGFGVKLPHNAKIVVQIHYPAGTAGETDSTRIRFFFSSAPSVRDVLILPVLNHNTNISPALVIPANTVRSFTEHFDLNLGPDFSLLGVAPHMHLLGQHINAFGVTPLGDTQRYISIPEWEFHWQGFYLLKQIKKVPNGTQIYSQATYDNTVNNPENPSSPPQNVTAGEATTNEMMITYFVITTYQPGDENILIDTTTPTAITNQPYYRSAELLQPYPVPAKSEVIAKLYFDKANTASLEVVNTAGQVVQEVFKNKALAEGYQTFAVPLNALAAGMYQLRLQTAAGVQVQKIIKQ